MVMIAPDLNYDLLSPRRIVFGWGRRRELPTLARTLGTRAFVVLGSRTLAASDAWNEALASLRSAGFETHVLATVGHEPEVGDVDALAAKLVECEAGRGGWLLAVGGGSAIDLAKAAAAMATNPQGVSVRDYLEGVGRGLQIVAPPIPLLAMPTTGGTGAEATKNAVITSYEPPFKKSLRALEMVPHTVLVDPELSCSVSPETTAWTGMDAITQLIEAYVCRAARPIPRALCVEGLRNALPAITEAVRDGRSRPAREAMSHAALLSGLALANSGLGLAHGVAAALGSVCRITHGLACAAMLPVALRVNREASRADLAALARSVGMSAANDDERAAAALCDRIDELCATLGVPRRLAALGVRREQIPELVVGSRGNSMNGNPRQLTDDELRSLLEELL